MTIIKKNEKNAKEEKKNPHKKSEWRGTDRGWSVEMYYININEKLSVHVQMLGHTKNNDHHNNNNNN